MIEIIDNVITIPNWSKHQTLDAYERQKERDRIKKQQARAQKKALISGKSGDASGDKSGDKSGDVPALEVEEEKEIEEDNISSIMPGAETTPAQPKAAAPASPVVISIMLNDKTEYPITESDIQAWKDLYPAVDILQELRKMKGWAEANPSKRKTKSGIKRFINGWLAKEQDKYHGASGGKQCGSVAEHSSWKGLNLGTCI